MRNYKINRLTFVCEQNDNFQDRKSTILFSKYSQVYIWKHHTHTHTQSYPQLQLQYNPQAKITMHSTNIQKSKKKRQT